MFKRKPKHEDQASVNAWADEVFGKYIDPKKALGRVCEEMSEYFVALVDLRTMTTEAGKKAAMEKILMEGADVYLCLLRAAEGIGINFHDLVDAKMVINRERTWKADGYGTGYHVPEQPKDYPVEHSTEKRLKLPRVNPLAYLPWKS